MVKLTAAIEPQ